MPPKQAQPPQPSGQDQQDRPATTRAATTTSDSETATNPPPQTQPQPPPEQAAGFSGVWQQLQQQASLNPWVQVQFAAMSQTSPQSQSQPQHHLLPAVLWQDPQQCFEALVAAVAERVRKDEKAVERNTNTTASELSAEDERVLVDALRKGKREGLTMLEVFEALNQKHDYPDTVWMKKFLAHFDKVYPKVALYTDAARAPPNGIGSTATSGSRPGSDRTATGNRPSIRTTMDDRRCARPQNPPAAPKTTTHTTSNLSRRAPASSANKVSSSSSTENRPAPPRGSSSALALAPYSANKPKQGLTFHDHTFIPPSDDSKKPNLPRRTPAPTGNHSEGNDSKLTNEEKVWFIHQLRWRLRGAGAGVPDKDTIFKELEAEWPHRTAKTWKRHWDSHPDAPDRLYAAAQNRARLLQHDAGASGCSSSAAPTPPLLPPLPKASQSTSKWEPNPNDPQDQTYHPSPNSDNNNDKKKKEKREKKKKAKPISVSVPTSELVPVPVPTPVPVSDVDLRAMALFKFENAARWKKPDRKRPLWGEFAERPENRAKRSSYGWALAAMNPRYAKAIRGYVQEHHSRSNASGEGEAASHSHTLPQRDKPMPASPLGAAKEQGLGDVKPAQKRPADPQSTNTNGDGAGKGSPPSKRKKTSTNVDPKDIIDLTIDTED